ncbi:hypothetical protein C8J57DRAFT_1529156 [Mycena rebaudengoi]|nr:hypothetical protein C8J57DRAFT_1529156 [Mycena rebaudengoi]
MKYKEFDQKVALAYNVKLIGWDKDRIPFVANISKPKPLKELLAGLDTKTIYFVKMTPEERAVVEARVAAEPSKRAPRKDAGKKRVKASAMDDDENNEDEGEGETARKKGEKRRRKPEEPEASSEEPAAKKAKGPRGASALGKPRKPQTEQEKKAAWNARDRAKRAQAKAAKEAEGRGGRKRKAKSDEFIDDDSDTPPPAKRGKKRSHRAEDSADETRDTASAAAERKIATDHAIAEIRRKRALIGASGSGGKPKNAKISGRPGRPPGRRSFPPMSMTSGRRDTDDDDDD